MLYDKLIAKVISCPECKGEMEEVHRAEENGVLYIWLECLKAHCSGQWLQKIPMSPIGKNAKESDDKVVVNSARF